jgi:hypothetical protein
MRRSNTELDGDVAALVDLSRAELAALWEKAHGYPPPKGSRNELLVRSASWHLQAKRLGGLSPEVRRLLRTAMTDAETALAAKVLKESGTLDNAITETHAGAPISGPVSGPPSQLMSPKTRRASPSPGARLVRDWNGKTHIVDVIEEGFVFQAKVHKSLTAIAHQITGAHWSGPRFFGL